MKHFIHPIPFILALLAALTLTACGDDDNDANGNDASSSGGDASSSGGDASSSGGDASSSGGASSEYYDGEASAMLGASGNQARCSTCHGNTADAENFSGNTMFNIAYHDSFKGGGAATLLDGTNACVTGWMGGTALTTADAEWTSLEAYLQSISDPSETTANAIAPEVLADEAAYEAAYAGGDATAGEAAYNAACLRCHGPSLTVGAAPAPALSDLSAYTVGRIAQQVRTSGPPPSGMDDAADSTPGPMPFFEPAELSSTDLANIIAYIKSQP